MIAHHAKRKPPADGRPSRPSRYTRLVSYLLDPKNKHERVGEVSITHCHSDDASIAALEVEAIQGQNLRAQGEKTYHLIVSFPPGEVPAQEVLKAIEASLCQRLGLADHQRISVVHQDTDHLHFHVAINLIHPKQLTINTPKNDFVILARAQEELEVQFGLQRVNHQSRRERNAGAQDLERRAGLESLVSWVKRECLGDLKSARSWQELHQVAERHGLRVQLSGAGCVITHGDIAVRASTVARELAFGKLVARFGPYVNPPAAERDEARSMSANAAGGEEGVSPRPLSSDPRSEADRRWGYRARPLHTPFDTRALFEQFQAERESGAQLRDERLRAQSASYAELIEAAKRRGRMRRAMIKLFGGGRLSKRLLYSFAHKTLLRELAEIRGRHQVSRQELYATARRSGWTEWLQRQAAAGNADALRVLRTRQGASTLRGNVVMGDAPTRVAVPVPSGAQATKAGVYVYRVGNACVREDARAIRVGAGASAIELREVLVRAMVLHGPLLRIDGDTQFRRNVVSAAAASGLAVRFDDAQLEHQRQIERRAYEQRRRPNACTTKQPQSETPGPDRLSAAPEPNAQRVRGPRSERSNGLRGVPERRVVHDRTRRESVLPGDVPRHVVPQGAERNQALRRPVSRARVESTRPPPVQRSRRGRSRASAAANPTFGHAAARGTGRDPRAVPPPVRTREPQRQTPASPARTASEPRRARKSVGQGAPPHLRQQAPHARNTPLQAGEPQRMQHAKPVGAVGRAAPPPRSRHRLHPLSQLQELRTGKTQPPVQSTQAAPPTQPAFDAVSAYVREREEKRARGLTVPQHSAFDGAPGKYTFVGRRTVAGCNLALLQRGDAIFVLQVPDDKQAHWSRLRPGRVVNVDARGRVRGRGR